MTLKEGTRLGPYEILAPLGAGGMGEVYRAKDTRLDRTVAIKTLPVHLYHDPGLRDRFEREARAVSSLNHPHICTLYDIGHQDGIDYLVMEYLEGQTLAARLIQGLLTVDQLLRYGLEIADALDEAHSKGIAHRDLKPANIMITHRGQVKVLDFGLAKLVEPGSQVLSSTAATKPTTEAGVVLGTVQYMSPEQAMGHDVDHRSDLFSLGSVLYEMATGRVPFAGVSATETVDRIVHSQPEAIGRFNYAVPPELERIIRKCLEKDRESRYQSARELLIDLRNLMRDSVTSEQVLRPRPNKLRKYAIAATVLTLLLLVAIGLYFFKFQNKNPSVVSPTAIAVLPFSVRGSAGISYLGEGMVNLLSTKLDGAGDLRSIDPRAVLGFVAREGDRTLDPERARTIADRLGARFFVLGDILEAGGRLRLDVALYDRNRSTASVGKATVEGKAANIFEMVDELAAQLLAGQGGGPGARLTSVAAVTTHSLPALKAYLEGESKFHAGHYPSAVEAFQRAVAEDPAFALAYYKLSVAAEWLIRPELAKEAAEAALRHKDRLSEHDRLLLEARLSGRRGAADEAEGRYRAILSTYTDDLEAWYQLGEVLFHYAPSRGRSILESRDAFERVLSFERDHVSSLYHLVRLAAFEGRITELDPLVDRIQSLQPEGQRALEMIALRAFAKGDPAARERVTGELRRTSDFTLMLGVWNVALFTRDFMGAKGLARLLCEPSRSTEVQALGHVWLAHMEMAGGRLKAAKGEFDAAEPLFAPSALEHRALLLVAPFLQVQRVDLEEIRERLARWPASVAPTMNRTSWISVHDGLHAHLRLYLLGLLNGGLGETAAAIRDAGELERLGESPEVKTFGRSLTQSVRAYAAWKGGRPKDALVIIEQLPMETDYELMMASPFYSHTRERYLRAELLSASGRRKEALHWYDTSAELSVYDLIYRAPSQLRRGEIYEQLGQREKAVTHYKRFVELWSECDPEFRPLVNKATGALR